MSESVAKGKLFVITGALERYERSEAYSLIRSLGGITSDNPVNSMDYLILGRALWSEMNNGLAPRKVVKALELRDKGKDVQIINEDAFYAMLDEALPTLRPGDECCPGPALPPVLPESEKR